MKIEREELVTRQCNGHAIGQPLTCAGIGPGSSEIAAAGMMCTMLVADAAAARAAGDTCDASIVGPATVSEVLCRKPPPAVLPEPVPLPCAALLLLLLLLLLAPPLLLLEVLRLLSPVLRSCAPDGPRPPPPATSPEPVAAFALPVPPPAPAPPRESPIAEEPFSSTILLSIIRRALPASKTRLRAVLLRFGELLLGLLLLLLVLLPLPVPMAPATILGHSRSSPPRVASLAHPLAARLPPLFHRLLSSGYNVITFHWTRTHALTTLLL